MLVDRALKFSLSFNWLVSGRSWSFLVVPGRVIVRSDTKRASFLVGFFGYDQEQSRFFSDIQETRNDKSRFHYLCTRVLLLTFPLHVLSEYGPLQYRTTYLFVSSPKNCPLVHNRFCFDKKRQIAKSVLTPALAVVGRG